MEEKTFKIKARSIFSVLPSPEKLVQSIAQALLDAKSEGIEIKTDEDLTNYMGSHIRVVEKK